MRYMEKAIVQIEAKAVNVLANLSRKHRVSMLGRPLIGSDAYRMLPPCLEINPYFPSNIWHITLWIAVARLLYVSAKIMLNQWSKLS